MANFYYFLCTRFVKFLFLSCSFLILSSTPYSSGIGIPGGEHKVAQVASIQSRPPGFFPTIQNKLSISSRGSSGYLNQNDGETEVEKKLRLVSQAEASLPGASGKKSGARRTTPEFIRADSQHGNNSVKKWKKLRQNGNHSIDPPPPPSQVAKMARYIVKNSNWSAMATVSSRDNDDSGSSPFSNVVSISDGPVDKSTGVPYIYVTPLDLSSKDLKVNPKMSLSMTLAQSSYCQTEEYDPEDPRCARVILEGNFAKLANGTDEEKFARLAIFSRHPVMKSWPKDHGFFFAKLDIKHIFVLDYFGGAKTVTPKEYFKAKF